MTNGKISGTAPNLVIWANAKSLLDIKYHTNETHTHTRNSVCMVEILVISLLVHI